MGCLTAAQVRENAAQGVAKLGVFGRNALLDTLLMWLCSLLLLLLTLQYFKVVHASWKQMHARGWERGEGGKVAATADCAGLYPGFPL